ncbi:hypothetical protein F7C95_11700 [Opitutia bacterium ISCC 51]|nr:hypothetical protein F7C95_11700 [Opitutae bacterium ISCC 51]QXD26689.1 hypothetical protein GA003_11630 [Opitutae bacterium ISCC 52]
MCASASSDKEPRVSGPDSEHRIPPPSAGKAAVPQPSANRSGVSVPVYPKLPDRPIAQSARFSNNTPYILLFDAFLALVSVAFCLLYYSEL